MSAKFIIEGQAKLSGEIEVKGAKNAALKIIPAAILSEEKTLITNLPEIEDVARAIELAEDLGVKISRSKNSCEISFDGKIKKEISPAMASKFRASIMFAGPILARFGEVSFPHPGGCVIGANKRPIDYFIEGFIALGAKVSQDKNFYRLNGKNLKGGNFFFPQVSVTGTESLMMTAALIPGRTILENCAMEPEITALAEHLNERGAKINGAGTSNIIIDGVKKIKGGKIKIMPDRIEAGTFAIMAAATKSTLTIKNCNPKDIKIIIEILKRQGVGCEVGTNWLKITPAKKILPYNIKTHEYPGFPTDLQSPYTVLATQAEGSTLIHETIYDRRLLFTDMLSQMGANIVMCDPHRVVVSGPVKLYGRKLTSPDLRAGISMIIAALLATGKTEIDNIYQIERGYENIADRLKKIGANIKRVE